MITLRDQLAAIIHAADCGCGGSAIDPAYIELADNILKTPDILTREIVDDAAPVVVGKWHTRFELLLPPIEHDDD